MSEYTLPRTGDRPMRFEGDELSAVSTRAHQGPGENRWWDLALYRTQDGRYIAAIGYHTQWQGEHDRDDVLIGADADDLCRAFKAHDPLVNISRLPQGYSERETSREQVRLATLRRCWESGLSELLGNLEPEQLL